MKRLFLAVIGIWCASAVANAQEWIRVHRQGLGTEWTVPMRVDQASQFELTNGRERINAIVNKEDGSQMVVPFSTENIDSISFSYDLADSEKGHDKHKVFSLHITTLDEAPIVVKEDWINCYISVDGKGEYSNYSGTGRIRGRGNSTWLWYDKKPYRIKLDSKSKLLGLEKAKDWNLLANYRDVTDLMNAFAFEAARHMNMPFTNHTRFVEVFLNEEYIGLYQLTEKIEVGPNRVNIDETDGVLLSFDADDGPELSPNDTDNFWSEVYSLPMCVKHPDDISPGKKDSIRSDFAKLEQAISERNFAAVDSLMDIESFIHILQLHEFLYNVEIDAPRSLYMFKDKGGKYTFGPVWDWDAGYDFDWGTMMTGHTFFTDYRELIYGTAPATHAGAAYHINGFWTEMFNDSTFVDRYKQLWAIASDSILDNTWGEMEKYLVNLKASTFDRDFERWPISGKRVDTEVEKMKQWLTNRLEYLNGVIANYPDGSNSSADDKNDSYEIVGNTIKIRKTIIAAMGYSQSGRIKIDEEDVISYLGVRPNSLMPLNSDGSQGSNTAAGTYGAWFDEEGDTAPWSWGHVYIESNEMFSWAFGCHPDNCMSGDSHTVRMQYRSRNKTMNVEVTFVVE